MITGENIAWTSPGSGNDSSQAILKGVSFLVREGRITTFMGPSGAGKTSLLRCLATLCDDYKGTIAHDGRDLRTLSPVERATTVGFVLQQFHLFPHLTVLENCTYALIHGLAMAPRAAEKRAAETLASLGMDAFLQKMPSQLSGGQQQRVAIARALVLQPKTLLLDEPTSALDPDSKGSLQRLLADLNEGGLTVALSSHDMSFIRKIADYIYFMDQGELVEEWDARQEELSASSKIGAFLAH